MRIVRGSFAYDIAEFWSATHDQKRYRYTVYKLQPHPEQILTGEKRAFHEAQADAEKYLELATTALFKGSPGR